MTVFTAYYYLKMLLDLPLADLSFNILLSLLICNAISGMQEKKY